MKKAGGRCHTISQSLDVQRELTARHGADVVFEEKLSGKTRAAEGLQTRGFLRCKYPMQNEWLGIVGIEVHSPTGVNPLNQLFAGQRGRGQNR
jgi:hypothetical protein